MTANNLPEDYLESKYEDCVQTLPGFTFVFRGHDNYENEPDEEEEELNEDEIRELHQDIGDLSARLYVIEGITNHIRKYYDEEYIYFDDKFLEKLDNKMEEIEDILEDLQDNLGVITAEYYQKWRNSNEN